MLGSPVQSGFLAQTPLDQDQDRLTSFHKPRETWPDQYRPVQSSLTQFFPVTRPVSTSYGPDWSETGRDWSFVYVYIKYFISTYITYYSISKKRHTLGTNDETEFRRLGPIFLLETKSIKEWASCDEFQKECEDFPWCDCCCCCIGKPMSHIEGNDVSEWGSEKGTDEGCVSVTVSECSCW